MPIIKINSKDYIWEFSTIKLIDILKLYKIEFNSNVVIRYRKAIRPRSCGAMGANSRSDIEVQDGTEFDVIHRN